LIRCSRCCVDSLERDYVERVTHLVTELACRVSPDPEFLPPPWLSLQGESGVQSFDLDGIGSIAAIPPTQITCFVDHGN
jgi:hypothetical protein